MPSPGEHRALRLLPLEHIYLHNALTFFHMNHSIHIEIFQFIDVTARPAYLHQIHFVRLAQAKMHTQIILRKIAATAAHFVHLLHWVLNTGNSSHASDPSANTAAVRLGTDRPYLDPVITCG